MSTFSTLLVDAFGLVLLKKLKISPFTIPFVLSTWLWLLGANGSFTYFPLNGSILQPHFNHNPE
jgi:urea transporter